MNVANNPEPVSKNHRASTIKGMAHAVEEFEGHTDRMVWTSDDRIYVISYYAIVNYVLTPAGYTRGKG